jgi:hypothetical protein
MLNLPWTFVTKSRGARSLGKAKDLFGPYQAIVPIAMRSWAQSNSGALELYLAAYIEGCRMTFDLSLIGILSLNSMSAYWNLHRHNGVN